jgi:hypothetical protein
VSDEARRDSVTAPAVEALLHLTHAGRDLCPEDTDPEAWAARTLDDLVRMSLLLDGAVEKVSGKRNETVGQHGRALASVIGAHRTIEVDAGSD